MNPATAIFLASLAMTPTALAAATTLSLDGQWQIADSVSADARPVDFKHRVAVPGLVNDKEQPVEGELRLTLETDSGKILTGARHPFNMTGFGKAREVLKLEIPADAEGKCLLKATASPRGKGWESPTVSRRWVQCR